MFSPIQHKTGTILAAAALAVVVLFGGIGSTAYAAKPGDALYQVKVSMEQVLQVADDQIETPVATHEIELTGTIEAINGDILTINGQQVQVSNLTEIKGTIAVGEMVKVHATPDASGMLAAREIETAVSGIDNLGDDDINDDHSNDGIEAGDDHGNDGIEVGDDHGNDGVEAGDDHGDDGVEAGDDHGNDGIEAGDDHGSDSSISSDEHDQIGNGSDDNTAVDNQDDSSHDGQGDDEHDESGSGQDGGGDDNNNHSGKGGSDD